MTSNDMLLSEASNGQLDATKLLIESRKLTPLHEASKEGFLDIVKYLIEKGADVNAEDKI